MQTLVRLSDLFFSGNCGANMTPSSNISSVIPVFNGEHYHIWAVKMRFYLRSQGLWNVVMSEADPPPLGANPTVAQMKAYEEEKLKKDKAITCLHSGLVDHIHQNHGLGNT